MIKTYPFSASLNYAFAPGKIECCRHCNLPAAQHSGGNCLFEASIFAAHELADFFSELMRNGGVLTITSGAYTLTQGVTASQVDERGHGTVANLRTSADATLEVRLAA